MGNESREYSWVWRTETDALLPPPGSYSSQLSPSCFAVSSLTLPWTCVLISPLGTHSLWAWEPCQKSTSGLPTAHLSASSTREQDSVFCKSSAVRACPWQAGHPELWQGNWPGLEPLGISQAAQMSSHYLSWWRPGGFIHPIGLPRLSTAALLLTI